MNLFLLPLKINQLLFFSILRDFQVTTTIKTTTPTNDLGLGYKVNGVADFCEGYVAGINLYDSSLSDTEIAAIFSEPDGPNTSDIPAIVVPGGSVATQEDIIAMVIALG